MSNEKEVKVHLATRFKSRTRNPDTACGSGDRWLPTWRDLETTKKFEDVTCGKCLQVVRSVLKNDPGKAHMYRMKPRPAVHGDEVLLSLYKALIEAEKQYALVSPDRGVLREMKTLKVRIAKKVLG